MNPSDKHMNDARCWLFSNDIDPDLPDGKGRDLKSSLADLLELKEREGRFEAAEHYAKHQSGVYPRTLAEADPETTGRYDLGTLDDLLAKVANG